MINKNFNTCDERLYYAEWMRIKLKELKIKGEKVELIAYENLYLIK